MSREPGTARRPAARSAGELQELARRHLLLHFTKNGLLRSERELPIVERGEGIYVFDAGGRRLVDGLSALYCNALGSSYGEEVAAAAAASLARLGFWPTWSAAHPAAIELAAELAADAPAGICRAFFTNGGSESVETAWKLVRQYHLLNGEPQRRKAIARDKAYHGVSLGALSFTGLQSMKEPFGPAPVEVRHVSDTNRFRSPDWPDDARLTAALLDQLEATIEAEGPETVAMLIAEPVQNAGGSIPPPEGYWRGLRSIADRHGIVLVADEVICAFGRLGEPFGSQRVGGAPDLITLAKALTAGYAPMGAVLVGERIAEPFMQPGELLMHGITFGGHPLSAAVALAALHIYRRDDVFEHVRALEPHLEGRLRELLASPIVGDVRGCGFLWTVEIVKAKPDERFTDAERAWLISELLPRLLDDAGLIARADDRGSPVIQIAPPLICSREELDLIVDLLGRVLRMAEAELASCRSPHTSETKPLERS